MSYMSLRVLYGEKPGGDLSVGAGKSRSPYLMASDVFCPECGRKSIEKCECPIGSHKCAKGHEWYYGKDGKPHQGNGHELLKQEETPVSEPHPVIPIDIKIDSKCQPPCIHNVLVQMEPRGSWSKGSLDGNQLAQLLMQMGKPMPKHLARFV